MQSTHLPLVEDFYTIQGEGRHAGRAAYFIRLGGCDVGCRWCDAKMTWNARNFPLTSVAQIVARAGSHAARSIVITGGEPTLYDLQELTAALRAEGLEIFLETSGTNSILGYFDWVCLSPKRWEPPMDENFERADELKVIVQSQDDIAWAEACATKVGANCVLYLQPEWGQREQIMPVVVDYVMNHPRWRVSLQSHKYMHIP